MGKVHKEGQNSHGIKNAKKKAERPVAYRFGQRAKMIQAIKDRSL